MSWLGPFRFANTLLFALFGWGMALAALQTWFGLDPGSDTSRIAAFIFGFFYSSHVWGTTQRHIVDLPSAVFFTAKYPVALGIALVATWLMARFLSKLVSVTLLGDGAGLSPPIEFCGWLAVAFFSLSHFEGLTLDANLSWLVAPRTPSFLGINRGSAQPRPRTLNLNTRPALGELLGWTELAEAARRWWGDQKRRVRRRPDDSPVQTASEARRRAEELL